ncbi:MAG: antitoxin [Candidatus Omnitrophica bacterium]|nr:antitoxin [Candidatus Omnitrophota bacterium]MDE2008492.1 antitoxin [Candidatus Omnitrophota bacterium]MDE2215196.1 antitoxin [Candidatus Omnitrophota bacterium]MDE2231387.1 antitoxin [Candidatus Omnitrophota bacterium]
MRTIKLTRQEKAIEEALLKGEYISVGKKEFNDIAQSLAQRRKDAVLNIRVNKYDLETLKQKAAKLGVGYQTFISEILHKVAQTV